MDTLELAMAMCNAVVREMRILLASIAMMLTLPTFGQGNDSLQTDTMKLHQINEVTVTSRRAGTRKIAGAVNGILIHREELFKAACCNLGESFITNPSVDVNYSDAATGAKQIKLLGLSGTYVQMLTENLPTSVEPQHHTPSTMCRGRG